MPCAARAWLGSRGRPLTANSITQPTKSWLSTCPLLWRIGSSDLIPPTVTRFGWTSRVLHEHKRVKIWKPTEHISLNYLAFWEWASQFNTYPQSRCSQDFLFFILKKKISEAYETIFSTIRCTWPCWQHQKIRIKKTKRSVVEKTKCTEVMTDLSGSLKPWQALEHIDKNWVGGHCASLNLAPDKVPYAFGWPMLQFSLKCY